MEIVWITENYIPNRGGMAQSCERIIRALRNRGVLIHILHFTNRRKPFKTENNIGGSYTALPIYNDISHTLNIALNFLTNPNLKFSFSKMVAFGGLLPMNGAPVYSKLFNVPLYTLIRGNDFDISVFSPRRKHYLDQIFSSSEAICVNSFDKAQKIKKLYPQTNVNYTPNSLDFDDWQLLKSEQSFIENWKKENIKESKKIFGLFGALKEKKGVCFFIDSIIKSGKKDFIHLLMTGDIEEKALELLNSKTISFTLLPFMDRNELIKYYHICDWICIPSFYEGMPNVMFEAAGLEVPILASNIDGMKDILEHKKNGLLFHPSDTGACSKQIFNATLMSDEKRKKLGENLKQKILDNFTIKKETENYINIFNGFFRHTEVTLSQAFQSDFKKDIPSELRKNK